MNSLLSRELSDDDAIVAMVDANIQREELLPSEKAFAYKMKLAAMKRQAGRPKNNSGQNDQNLIGTVSRDVLAEQVGESSKQIQILSIFNNCVMAKKVSRSLTFSEKKLTKYFPDDYTAKDMEQVIESLLEKWMQEQSC